VKDIDICQKKMDSTVASGLLMRAHNNLKIRLYAKIAEFTGRTSNIELTLTRNHG
jgi:hypothetical protein